MSFCKLIFHIVFASKGRKQLIMPDVEWRVYTLLYTLMTKMDAQVLRIGGMPDHVHLLAIIPPSIALSDFVKELKRESSIVMKQFVPEWDGWQEGYGCFSYSVKEIDTVVNYIMRQKEHHQRLSFRDEYRSWLIENGVSEDEPYFPK